MIQFPRVIETPVYWNRFKRRGRAEAICPKNKALVDADTGNVFAVVSKGYKLIRHEEALDIVSNTLKKNPEFGQPDPEIRMMDAGAKMWTTFTFPDTEYDISGGDLVHPTIEVMNSYDTGWSFSVRFGAFRLVCSNGLVVGKAFAWYKHKHTKDLNPVEVEKILCAGMEQYSEQVELWRKWVDKITMPDEYERVVEGLGLNKTEMEQLEQEVEQSSDIELNDLGIKTLRYWIFYNIVTALITHGIRNSVRRANLMMRAGRLF